MSQNKSQNWSQQSGRPLPAQVVEQIVETQKQQIVLQTQELKLREKELEVNARLAEKQMTYQADIIKNKPAETRKSFQAAAIFVILLFALVLYFFGYCVHSGHKDFALKVFGYIMYAVTTIAGYYAGRKSVRTNKDRKADHVEEAIVVD
jgi:hypothetical protein